MRPAVLPLLCLISVSPVLQAAPAQARAFERLDQDNDETLSLAELLEVTTSLDGGFAQTNAIIHAWFDADESGDIDLGEWQDGRAGNGDSDAPDLAGAAFPELDANGNGKVARKEFWKVITRYVPAAVARAWYPAQFPGGQVTGSSSQHTGGTLNLGGGLGIVPVGGSGTIGDNFTSGGVSAQWTTLDPGSAGTWLANLPERDLTLSSGIIQSRMTSDPSVVAMWLFGNFTETSDSGSATGEDASDRRGSRDTSGEPWGSYQTLSAQSRP